MKTAFFNSLLDLIASCTGNWRRALAYAAIGLSLPLPAAAAEVSVTRLSDDVWHFRYGFHSNMFVVTDDGVVATDPLSPAAAEACLAEIRKITDQPIRYLIYSHDHTDHIAGGTLFPEDVTVIAHRNAASRIGARDIDVIRPPDLLVDDEHVLRVGGKEIRLYHPGRVESASALVIHVPEDRVLMWVDAVRSFGVPYRHLEGYDLYDFTNALEEVRQRDFDVLIPGHGPPTNRGRVDLFADYLAEMQAIAEREMRAYTQADHRAEIGNVNPERYFDSYIETVARRVIERMRPTYGELGGFDDWGRKNAERAVVFLLHEILFFE